ncbi:sialin isoform X1 [Polypterus senegalus]|uniref:sialin isoform X1 n=1 Tax=Polypterus senegalus TaxID=55291 RepID=UPI0019652D81|nr:sialin isoform X1 [Polypterus senegalus]XP_039595283.1 sialin isoform X1 [Polypterus senegalus]
MAVQDGQPMNLSDSEDGEWPTEEVQPLLDNKAQTLGGAQHVTNIPLVPLAGSRQCCSARWNLSFLMFLGFGMVYALRVNLSVAMVAMVNGTAPQPVDNSTYLAVCPDHSTDNSSNTSRETLRVQQFQWDSTTQGVILSSFFYGYILTQVPGGYLAGYFGGKLFLGLGVLVTAVLTLLTPLAASLGVPYLVILRALEGFGEGVTYPAMNAMWAKWAPPLERSRLMTFSGTGGSFGSFVALPITGFICHSLGWAYVFYIFGKLFSTGAAGCIWALLWFCLVTDEPLSHPRISKQERDHITSSVGLQGKCHGWTLPFLSMLTSLPLWAIIIAHFCINWSFYTLLTTLPSYMSQVLHFSIKENGFLSAVPYFTSWVMSIICGQLADRMRERRIASTTFVRKMFTVIGSLLPAAFFIATAFIDCDYVAAMVFLTVSSTLIAANSAGFSINHIDIAPRYAGVLLGITNTFGTLPGMIAPTVVGYLTAQNALAGWKIVFYISAAILTFGGVFYTAFGSGEPQVWSKGIPEGKQRDQKSITSPTLINHPVWSPDPDE